MKYKMFFEDTQSKLLQRFALLIPNELIIEIEKMTKSVFVIIKELRPGRDPYGNSFFYKGVVPEFEECPTVKDFPAKTKVEGLIKCDREKGGHITKIK